MVKPGITLCFSVRTTHTLDRFPGIQPRYKASFMPEPRRVAAFQCFIMSIGSCDVSRGHLKLVFALKKCCMQRKCCVQHFRSRRPWSSTLPIKR
jgi:hypothetical protein